MSLKIKVECPQCGKIWIVPQGTPDITCDCHLYCERGTKPEDCSLTKVTFSGNLNVFTGLHLGHSDSDDVLHRTYYCSTHDYYSYKQPILIETGGAVAQHWFSRRAPKNMREVGAKGMGT